MIKTQRIHHSITENGNFQGRLVTQYKEADGTLISESYSDPMEPDDYDNLEGWDDRTVDIITAVREPALQAAFGLEKAEINQHPEHKPNSGVFQSQSFDREITEDGTVRVRQIDRVFDDGIEISKKFHRSSIVPGADPSNADVLSKSIAVKLHTPAVIQAFKDKQAVLASV